MVLLFLRIHFPWISQSARENPSAVIDCDCGVLPGGAAGHGLIVDLKVTVEVPAIRNKPHVSAIT